MKLNYYRATNALISFKQQFEHIQTKKNVTLLNYLKSIELDVNSDDSGVPDVSKICGAINLPRAKVYTILYQTYIALLESLAPNPARITDCVHAIYIARHHERETFIQRRGKRSKDEEEALERESARTFWGEFRLPMTPRLGETISLDFIDWNIRYCRGVVTDIQHEITGFGQRIVIYVHPLRNYFWRWKHLEREFNEDEARQRYWKQEAEEISVRATSKS